MTKPVVSIVKYEKPMASVRKSVELCGGLDHLPDRARVFIKPNIVMWTQAAVFPKWGTITTSRVVEDMVVLLKERGVDEILIGEGIVLPKLKDRATPEHAFEMLGYKALEKRYGVKCLDIHTRPFETVDLGAGVELNMNADILHSDFVVDLPVLKTHIITVVSLGIKNLKGMLDIESRKKCHGTDPVKDLHYMVARLPNKLPPSLTLIDGIYTNERGPGINGKMRRSNILVASPDILAADMVGAKLLGYEPAHVPHLVHAAGDRQRSLDLSDIDLRGESIEDNAALHEYDFPYADEGNLPAFMKKAGVKGLAFPKYDITLCTYCASLYPVVMGAIAQAWKGEPWGDIEVLSGKMMKPNPDMKKTVLIGKCMCDANQGNPDIQEEISVMGCPPHPKVLVKCLQKAGFDINPAIVENWEENTGLLMKKYEGKPEFEESFFRIE
ncbi:DUF362 domain-containing protein [Thermodesulfobacteriota bacterium]